MTCPPQSDEVLVCFRCDEVVDQDDDCLINRGRAQHRDCLVRAVVGGVNHQRGLCTCCGGKLPPDPPSLSKREAARVAAMHHRRREAAAPA